MRWKRLLTMGPAEIACRLRQRLCRWEDAVLVGAGWFRDYGRFAPLTHNQAAITWPAPPVAEAMLAETIAGRILNGVLPVFDGGELPVGQPVSWRRDPINDVEAPPRFWGSIPYLDFGLCGDHRVVWEINRLQFLVILGRAYRATRDERLAQHFQRMVMNWAAANPYGRGINWCSSMEVALRAIALITGLRLFTYSSQLSADTLRAINGLLALSARHIERNLSVYFAPNNHLIAEGLGLFYIGAYFERTHPRSGRWRDLGWRIVRQQSARQTLGDGVHDEQSVGYHRFVTECYLHAVRLAHESGLPLPPEFAERTQRMVSVARNVRLPNGEWPRIGDDDGGRVLPVTVNEFADVAPPEHSAAFREAGWFVMRDGGQPTANYLFLKAGPLGPARMRGGHGHADLLSFEAHAWGRPALVDAGTFGYLPVKWRDYHRQTAAHNTITVDGRGQAEPEGLFAWRRLPAAQVARWEPGEDEDVLDASHDAYAALGVRHRRVVWFRKGCYWLIVDLLDGAGEHTLEHRLHCAPCRLENAGPPGATHLRLEPRGGMAVVCVASAPRQLAQEDYWLAPRYGSRHRAPLLTFTMKTRLPAWFATLLVPLRSGPAREAKLWFDGRRARVRVTDAEGRSFDGEHSL